MRNASIRGKIGDIVTFAFRQACWDSHKMQMLLACPYIHLYFAIGAMYADGRTRAHRYACVSYSNAEICDRMKDTYNARALTVFLHVRFRSDPIRSFPIRSDPIRSGSFRRRESFRIRYCYSRALSSQLVYKVRERETAARWTLNAPKSPRYPIYIGSTLLRVEHCLSPNGN